MTVAYHAYQASHALAVERGRAFASFPTSDYAKPAGEGNYFDRSHRWPSVAGAAHRTRPAAVRRCAAFISPRRVTGRSCVTRSCATASTTSTCRAVAPDRINQLHQPCHQLDPSDRLEDRDPQGGQDRAAGLLPGRIHDQREPRILPRRPTRSVGRAIVDTYAEATQHVDQGLSLTLFFPDTATTRDLNQAQIYAWRKGIKTLYLHPHPPAGASKAPRSPAASAACCNAAPHHTPPPHPTTHHTVETGTYHGTHLHPPPAAQAHRPRHRHQLEPSGRREGP